MNSRDDSSSLCHFCGSGPGVFRFSATSIFEKTYHLYHCKACGAHYFSPQPDAADLQQAYADDYYGEGEEKFSGWIERVLNGFRRMRAQTVLKRTQPGDKVLDIGCGNCMFLKFVHEAGRDAYGIELPGKALERGKRIPGLNLTAGTLQPNLYAAESFDMITLWHVFEHLTEPKMNLDEITRILKPGGHLVLSLPNIESWQSHWFRDLWFHLDPPRHLFFMGPKALTRELELRGFSLRKTTFLSLEQNPFGFQQSLLNKVLSHREVLFEALKGRKGGGRGYSSVSILAQKLFYMSTFPLFAVLAAFEAVFQRGGTMELAFQKHPKDG